MERLLYRIISASSESSFHPATELEANNVIDGPALGDGWSTSNYVHYPQTLLMEFFADACSLRRIILLSHETKIPSTIEIFAGLGTRRRLDDESIAEAKREAGHCRFTRLGHVNFSSNEQTGYGAREQKDIQVNCDARFLKLIIHAPHKNRTNLYRQAAIVSIKILGRIANHRIEFPLEASIAEDEENLKVFDEYLIKPMTHSTNISTKRLVPLLYEVNDNGNDFSITDDRPSYANSVDTALLDLGIPMSLVSETRPKYVVDKMTGNFLQELAEQKEKAVSIEDYNEAKKIKLKMDRITGMGDKINSLEEQKAFCLMSEKFDEAARLKEEIMGLRKIQHTLLDEHMKHDNKIAGYVNSTTCLSLYMTTPLTRCTFIRYTLLTVCII